MALSSKATQEQNYQFPLNRDLGYNTKIKFQAVKVIPPQSDTGLGAADTAVGLFDTATGRGPAESNNVAATNPLQFFNIDGEVADLYMPLSFAVNDGMDYAQSSLGLTGAAASSALNQAGSIGGAIGAGLSEMGQSIGDLFNSISTGEVSRLAALRGSQLIPNEGIRNAVGITARATMNPNVRTNFNGVNLREFSFAFKFIPTSAQESQAVKRIIKFFRYHSYPEEIGAIGSFSVGYDYPDMFKIRLLSKGNDERFKNVGTPIKLCYLKSVSHTYNPTSPVLHADGAPNEIDLNLNFVEYKALSRKDVANEDNDSFYHFENGTEIQDPGTS